jgi:superfamily II DNA/RNA helicase
VCPCCHMPAAVNLLDPATAAKLTAKQQTPQQQAQQRSKQGPQQLHEAVAAAPALSALLAGGLNPVVPRCMAKLGFIEPTPIQSACWRPACAGKDLLGHAEPGGCPVPADCRN